MRKKGIPANVINAGVLGDTTAGMLRRVASAVPKGTNIVILQPGANDLRFGFSKEQRAANIAAMVRRLRARNIRVIVFDPEIPTDFYQWDHIHFNAAAHAKIAAKLVDEIAAEPMARPARRLLRNRRHRRNRSLAPRAKKQWHGARRRCNGTDQLGYQRAPGAAPTAPEP